MDRAGIKRRMSVPEQLEYIAATLTAVRRLKDYLNRCKQFELGLAYYEENMDALDDIYQEIYEKIRGQRVDDFASRQLKSLREEIDRTGNKMREKADAVMRANAECMSDTFSTTRNGHICIPVKKAYKFKIDEENEERRTLYTLSGLLSDKADIIRTNNRTIEKLDFIFAKAKLSLEYDGISPALNTERYIRLAKGRHPLMDKAVNVPLDFTIGKGVNGVVIIGSNAVGKTVAIKTVA